MCAASVIILSKIQRILHIDLVFTAPPTQGKRRTVLCRYYHLGHDSAGLSYDGGCISLTLPQREHVVAPYIISGFWQLAAIPWGFSWMQSRYVLLGWYGVGEALEAYGDSLQKLQQLQTMYREWPFFKVMIDNAQVSLAKADMGIARLYAELVSDEEIREKIFGEIETAFQRARTQILRVTGQRELLDNDPTLQCSVRRRNPYVDPLNFIQVGLLGKLRSLPQQDSSAAQELLQTIFLTINGIASGLKNTG